MENFTPWTSLAGGALIGLAAAILLYVNGRIAGISGIVNGLLSPSAGEIAWRAAFLVGLICGGAWFISGAPLPFIPRSEFPLSFLLTGGFLVGFGTRLGSGCTSGHGVCGISRLSPRSMLATVLFVAAGMLATTLLTRPFAGG